MTGALKNAADAAKFGIELQAGEMRATSIKPYTFIELFFDELFMTFGLMLAMPLMLKGYNFISLIFAIVGIGSFGRILTRASGGKVLPIWTYLWRKYAKHHRG